MESPSVTPRDRLVTWIRQAAWPLVLYTFLSLALFGFRNALSNSYIVGGVHTDMVQETWFLAWFAHAVAHLQNPFISHALNAPAGINLMANTSMPLLGIVFAPLTWVFGPLATYNFLLRVALIVSALAGRGVARRIGLSPWAATAVGLIYGFSTQQTVQSNGHLFLTFAPLLPWVLYTAYRLVIGEGPMRRTAVTLGLLLGTDFLISAERALIEVVAIVLGGLIAALIHRRHVVVTVRRLGRVVPFVAGSLLVLVSVPLAFQVAGQYAVRGNPHSWIAAYRADFFSFVLPQHFSMAPILGHKIFIERLTISPWENGTYIGVVLLAVCATGLWVRRRSATARWMALLTFGLTAMTFGPDLLFHGRSTALYSPYKLLTYLPLLKNVAPVRYMMVVWFGLALFAGFAVDHFLQRPRRSLVTIAGLASVVLGVVLISPAQAIPSFNTSVNPWFHTPEASRVLRAHSTVLFYPYPSWLVNQPMLIQSLDAMRYRIIGGQAIVNSGPGGQNWGVRPLNPHAVPDIFFQAYISDVVADPQQLVAANHWHLGALPSLADGQRACVQFVSRYHVNEIVVEKVRNWQVADRYLRAAFGPPTLTPTGLEIWSGIAVPGRS